MTWRHSPGSGQAKLTDQERERFDTGNQHEDRISNIGLQVVKAEALRYNVSDWTSYVDSTLTVEENCEIMRKNGWGSDGPTMRELKPLIEVE